MDPLTLLVLARPSPDPLTLLPSPEGERESVETAEEKGCEQFEASEQDAVQWMCNRLSWAGFSFSL